MLDLPDSNLNLAEPPPDPPDLPVAVVAVVAVIAIVAVVIDISLKILLRN